MNTADHPGPQEGNKNNQRKICRKDGNRVQGKLMKDSHYSSEDLEKLREIKKKGEKKARGRKTKCSRRIAIKPFRIG